MNKSCETFFLAALFLISLILSVKLEADVIHLLVREYGWVGGITRFLLI